MDTNLRGEDPGRWGHSLANAAEILTPFLDAAGAKSVAEVGAYEGVLTRELLDWASRAGARVTAIDPMPEPRLIELDEQRPELELIRETSHDALPRIPVPDALIVDGDHNYYTVSEELRLIAERSPGAELPLLMFHDAGWPHARRDHYYVPDQIPDDYRQPMAHAVCLVPGEPGVGKAGLFFGWVAEREGGARNGVLTAIEDFVEGREKLRLAIVPGFFGLAIVWHEDAPWANAVAELVEPWDRNPVLARLETNRLFHLAEENVVRAELWRLRERNAKQERLLRRLLDSSAFASADRLSHLRRAGRSVSWRDQVREALDEDGEAELSDRER